MMRLSLFLPLLVAAAPALAAPPTLGTSKGAGGELIQDQGVVLKNSNGSSAAPGDPATSTPLVTSTTSSGGTISSGASQSDQTGTSRTASCSGTTTAVCGPFYPQLGRAIWARRTGTFAGSITIGTTIDGLCADAVPYTVQDTSMGVFTGAGDSLVGAETRSGAGWCITGQISSGTAAVGLYN